MRYGTSERMRGWKWGPGGVRVSMVRGMTRGRGVFAHHRNWHELCEVMM